MALPASGTISLGMIQAEFGGTYSLQYYGSLVFGRANCSLQEFYGKSSILTYYPTFPPSRHTTVSSNFATPHGNFYFVTSSTEASGNNYQEISLSPNVGYTPITKLIDLHIPWMGYTWTKAELEALGYFASWSGGNFSGGTIVFRFLGT